MSNTLECTENELLQKCNKIIEQYGKSGHLGKFANEAMFFARHCKKLVEEKQRLKTKIEEQLITINILNDIRKL